MDEKKRTELLDELPRRMLNGEAVVYKEFEDLENLVATYTLGGATLILSSVKSWHVGRNLA